MEIIRKELKPSDIYPDDIRVEDDVFQRLIEGEWIDAPEVDPRTHNVYPPKVGGTSRCDTAANIIINLQGLVNGIIDAVCNGASAYAMGTFIIGILTIFAGLFGLLLFAAIAIGSAALSLGCGDLGDAFTSTVWDDLLCIIEQHLGGDNRLDQSRLDGVKGQVTSDIGGTAATVLNLLFDLIGFGGLNSMGATGAETGDCSDCADVWCYRFDFSENLGDWSAYPDPLRGGLRGFYDGEHWRGSNVNSVGGAGLAGSHELMMRRLFPQAADVTRIEIGFSKTAGYCEPVNDYIIRDSANGWYNGTQLTSRNANFSATNSTWVWTGTTTITDMLTIWFFSALKSNGNPSPEGEITVSYVQLEGTGDNPFSDNNNCTPT